MGKELGIRKVLFQKVCRIKASILIGIVKKIEAHSGSYGNDVKLPEWGY